MQQTPTPDSGNGWTSSLSPQTLGIAAIVVALVLLAFFRR